MTSRVSIVRTSLRSGNLPSAGVRYLTVDRDAPTRLRRLVLSLAVRGMLVDQQASDGTAEDCVLESDDSPAPPGIEGVRLPSSWQWARFTSVADIESNLVSPSKHLDMPHVAPDCIEKGTGRLLGYKTVRDDRVISSKHRFFAGQILYSKIRPNLSKAVLVGFDGLCSADMYPLRARIDSRYLLTYLLSDLFLRQVIQDDNRIAMPKVNQQQLSATVVAVPPFAEQKRIVAKVDQLMALCDELEAKQARKRELGCRLTKAAMSALTAAGTRSEFKKSWNWTAGRIEIMADSPAGVDELRTAVLCSAIRGRFSDHLGEPLPPTDELFSLPMGWTRVRTDEAGEVKLGRQRSPANHFGPHMRPYLRVANVHEARIDTRDVLEMNFDPDEAERFLLRPNDVLLNEGQSYELVGRPALYRGEVPGACFQNTLIRFRAGRSCDPRYALVVFRAYLRSGRFMREAQQTTNMAHLSAGRLASIEFPLPPLTEQRQIAAKVEHLLANCDGLEARVRARDENAARLADALLRSAVA